MPSEPISEISVERLAEKLRGTDRFVLLDVRETWELDLTKIQDARLEILPMSRLARTGVEAVLASAGAPQA
jgi:hypothetical protein